MGDRSTQEGGSGDPCSESNSGPVLQPVSSETMHSESGPIDDDQTGTKSSLLCEQDDIVKVLQILERDSIAIADSFTSLFASLRLALSEVTNSSVDHMQCFSDAVGHLQESVLDATSKGNRYINSCIRLNEEMKGIESLASQLRVRISGCVIDLQKLYRSLKYSERPRRVEVCFDVTY